MISFLAFEIIYFVLTFSPFFPKSDSRLGKGPERIVRVDAEVQRGVQARSQRKDKCYPARRNQQTHGKRNLESKPTH